jgi:hypothetical protein
MSKKTGCMICPKCRAEYRQGIIKCPECEVDLVDIVPLEQETKFSDGEPVEVFSTYDMADVVFIKSLLDAEKIGYYFKGESSLYVVKPLVGNVKLIVKKSDEERVRELLKDIPGIK